jgi:putative transposase
VVHRLQEPAPGATKARTGGWFRTADGQRCDPLTITDADSRFLIECRIVPETTQAVQPVVEQAFGELGLPRAIRSDNSLPLRRQGARRLPRPAARAA